MNHNDFLKLQAKNLLKDFKSCRYNENDGTYEYSPKYFDIEGIFTYFEIPYDNNDFSFTLQNAQHIIAKMVGYEKWDDLIHSTESWQALAELLLRRFKTAEDIQDWEDTVSLAFADVIQQYGLEAVGPEALLDYARWHFELGDRQQIVNLPPERISIVLGNERDEALSQFDDKNNPNGSLRTHSIVQCTCCRKPFDFMRSKVIKDNESNLTMVVCKNYPKCKGTYLDYKVLTHTVLYDVARTQELEKGAKMFNLTLDSNVECIHCGEQFLYNEANAVVDADDGQTYIHCKNYPKCDGTLIDMMPISHKQ